MQIGYHHWLTLPACINERMFRSIKRDQLVVVKLSVSDMTELLELKVTAKAMKKEVG